MASLAQLLAHHESILVLDAASTRFQAGLLRRGQPGQWHTSPDEAGKSLFEGTARLLADGRMEMPQIAAFIYCTGPGSMLGTRTVAMALRTWNTLRARPVFSYQSLAVAARGEWHRRPRAFSLIADARRDTWHCQSIAEDGHASPLMRVPAAALPAGELLTPEGFRAWAAPARPTAICPYDLAPLFPLISADDLFTDAPVPDAFQHEAPEYKKWSAEIHRAESATRS